MSSNSSREDRYLSLLKYLQALITETVSPVSCQPFRQITRRRTLQRNHNQRAVYPLTPTRAHTRGTRPLDHTVFRRLRHNNRKPPTCPMTGNNHNITISRSRPLCTAICPTILQIIRRATIAISGEQTMHILKARHPTSHTIQVRSPTSLITIIKEGQTSGNNSSNSSRCDQAQRRGRAHRALYLART